MKKSLLIALALLMGGFNSLPSFAASQDECAIWLCLPAGFPSGCSAAKSAFKNRIKHHQSPLPAFSSCAVEQDNGGTTYTQGKAIWVEAKTCDFWYQNLDGKCVPSPAHWVKDGQCITMGCQSKSYIDVKVEGNSVGGTYFY
jgi:hypothetical protein